MKMESKERSKNSEGITLIALVITIIVLLILAGVSISMTLNQDGIFSRAEQVADKYAQAKAREMLELLCSDAQTQKYESGLTDQDLDKRIAEIEGELLPKEKPNTNLQNVIVDGYIFEIDRSVPKIVDYIGPADGVIITALVIQNGDWQNPVATVTGKITKYGGGKVISSTATATSGVAIPSNFPTLGGNYIIPNITTDTDITITASADDGKPAVTKKIEVRLVRDNMPPVISDAKAEATLMKIKISAKAVDNESGLKRLTYTVTCPEGGTITEGVTGNLTSGVEKELTATAEGEYTVTFTAEDNAGNIANPEIMPKVKTINLMSVDDAKKLINESNIHEYMGTKVDYQSPKGGIWRVFYYDGDEGYFGRPNTVYLKKDYEASSITELSLSEKTNDTDSGVTMMRKMNPLWSKSSNHNLIDKENEKACVWLCDTSVWNSEKNDKYSSYAIGSPSIEMFVKSYNQWKRNDTALVYKLDTKSNGYNGYWVGANGKYAGGMDGTLASECVDVGPAQTNLYRATDGNVLLSSPAGWQVAEDRVTISEGEKDNYYSIFASSLVNSNGLMPIVPLDLDVY